jgi:hypothetical protein
MCNNQNLGLQQIINGSNKNTLNRPQHMNQMKTMHVNNNIYLQHKLNPLWKTYRTFTAECWYLRNKQHIYVLAVCGNKV